MSAQPLQKRRPSSRRRRRPRPRAQIIELDERHGTGYSEVTGSLFVAGQWRCHPTAHCKRDKQRTRIGGIAAGDRNHGSCWERSGVEDAKPILDLLEERCVRDPIIAADNRFTVT
ncbi:MAG TPA: hypothetical protein VK648_12700 [Gemmatimonadaceae bacterium]|nr:hypothetical protein [Gemmatimonadaceae bacterium]